MSARIPIVSVGAGWVTTHRHVPALLRDPRAEVIGIVDDHAERAVAAAEKFRLPHRGTALDGPWVDHAVAATIGTPPARHAEVAINLLERGLHVLCEKPMATSLADAEAMAAAAAKAERRLALVHNFQFAGAMLRARRLLGSGTLGELTALYAFQMSNPNRRLPTWYSTLRGGLFYDEAPHLLYLLRALLGDLTLGAVTCKADRSTNPGQVQQLDAHFEHPTVWAQLTMNFRAPLSEWQFVMVGTEQTVAVDIFRDISVLLPNDHGHTARDILRTSWRAFAEHLAGVVRSGFGHVTGKLLYGNEIVTARFLDAVQGEGDLVGISAADGVAVVRLMHEILDRADL